MWLLVSAAQKKIQSLPYVQNYIQRRFNSSEATALPFTPIIQTKTLWVGQKATLWSRVFGTSDLAAEKMVKDTLDKVADFSSKAHIIPSPKQRGCYINFKSVEDARKAFAEINMRKGVHSWFVQGEPFVEDLISRAPTPRLRVQMVGNVLSQETLFREFRPYGKMKDIIFPEKDGPVRIWFKDTQSATAARNCLHGKRVDNTMMVINYDARDKLTFLTDLLKSPRITVPLTGISFVLASILLINPMRYWFVFQKLTVEQQVEVYYRERQSSFIWLKETEKEKDLRDLLRQKPQGVILFMGPKGTNKSTLLKKISRGRMFSVRIPCGDVETTADFMDAVIKAIGFRPSFNALNTLLLWFTGFLPNSSFTPPQEAQFKSMMEVLNKVLSVRAQQANEPAWIIFDDFDKFVQILNKPENKDEYNRAHAIMRVLSNWSRSVTNWGVAQVMYVGDSPQTESTLRNTEALRTALLSVQMTDVGKDEVKQYLREQMEAYRESVIERKRQLEATNQSLLDKWLNFKNNNTAAQEQDNSDEVDAFMPISYVEPTSSTNDEPANDVKTMDNIVSITDDEAKFASGNAIHVAIKATNDAAVHRAAVVVPNLKEDLSRFVVPDPVDEKKLDQIIDLLGGRLADLERFISLTTRGVPVDRALKLLKDEAKKEIRSKGFGSKFAPGTSTFAWSHKQLWATMHLLVERGFVPYDELLFTVFEGNEGALKSLAEKHLISFNKVGDKKAVTPYSPLYLAVFKDVVQKDPSFSKGVERFIVEGEVEKHKKDAAEIQKQLVDLGSINYPATGVKLRMHHLDAELRATQEELMKFEVKLEKLKAEAQQELKKGEINKK